MKERDIVQKIKKELANPFVAKHLGIGTVPGRWIKIPDSWGCQGGKGFAMFKGADLVWATDCMEVKIVKAKTNKGMVFRPFKQLHDKQREYLSKHNGLVGVGFVKTGERDALVSIVVIRWLCIERNELKEFSRFNLEGSELAFVIKGSAHKEM